MNTLAPEQQARVAAALHPAEELLWVGKPCSAPMPAATPGNGGFLSNIWRWFGGTTTQAHTEEETIYLLTAKRAVVLSADKEPREWPLMLGMIQKFNEAPDGSGDVIFEHDYDERTETRTPRGFLNVADADRVRMLVSSAADAAYNASPWSV